MCDAAGKSSSPDDGVPSRNDLLSLKAIGEPGVHRLAHQPPESGAHHENRHENAARKLNGLRYGRGEILHDDKEGERNVQIVARGFASGAVPAEGVYVRIYGNIFQAALQVRRFVDEIIRRVRPGLVLKQHGDSLLVI